MTEEEVRFREFLKETAAIVKTWPRWKQEILGSFSLKEETDKPVSDQAIYEYLRTHLRLVVNRVDSDYGQQPYLEFALLLKNPQDIEEVISKDTLLE